MIFSMKFVYFEIADILIGILPISILISNLLINILISRILISIIISILIKVSLFWKYINLILKIIQISCKNHKNHDFCMRFVN